MMRTLIIGGGAAGMAAAIAEVIPHLLKPVATYRFSVRAEYGPI